MTEALRLFDLPRVPRRYHEAITANLNAKGCMEVDTVKGCTEGMREPGGCYMTRMSSSAIAYNVQTNVE